MPPYRVPSPPSSAGVPRDLIYSLPEAPASVASLILSLGHRMAAALGRRMPAEDERHVVLRVELGELSVRTGGRPMITVALRELLDVELDTRSIEKLQGQVRPDGVLGTGPSVPLDIARLVLVISGRSGIPLSDAYASYGESLEWMAKVRHFLRRHGWVPQDERDTPP